MGERIWLKTPSPNNTLVNLMGLNRMAGSEFQDRCLKPLGHPSKPLRRLDHLPSPTLDSTSVAAGFIPTHPAALSMAARMAASTFAAASSCIPGITREYRSRAMPMLEWPRRSCAILGWMPLVDICVAWLCCRSWKRMRGQGGRQGLGAAAPVGLVPAVEGGTRDTGFLQGGPYRQVRRLDQPDDRQLPGDRIPRASSPPAPPMPFSSRHFRRSTSGHGRGPRSALRQVPAPQILGCRPRTVLTLSSTAAACRIVVSACQRPTTCTLMGRPSRLVPKRIDSPGKPVTFRGTVAPCR